MAAKPVDVTSRVRSRTPEAIVDLTVDSPINYRLSQGRRRASVLRHGVSSAAAETSNVATVIAENTDVTDLSNRLLPPKKRARKGKTSKVEAIIDLDDIPAVDNVPQVNDTITGETNVLACPICFEDLSSKRKPTSTRCGHIYCAECIEQTLLTSKKCPKCQAGITSKSCIRLYF